MMNTKKKGFTLVELLAVIVILGILMIIGTTAVINIFNKVEVTTMYDYSRRLFQRVQESGAFSALEQFDYEVETGYIADLSLLGLDNNHEYKGYIFYNNVTDEISLYIHNDKYMIVNFTSSDTRKENELVVPYTGSFEDQIKFSHQSICNDYNDLFVCIYMEGNSYGIDYNRLKGPGIVGVYNEEYSVHNIIRQLAKPGSVEYKPDSGYEEYSDMIDTVKKVEVKKITTPPAGAVNLSLNPANGSLLSEEPVYLWFDSSTGTLYFGSSTGKVNLYENCSDMFKFLSELTEIDLTNFNFNYVTSLNAMFAYCTKLRTIKTKDSYGESWNLNLVKSTEGMFHFCEALEEIDFGDWDTGNLSSIAYMFHGCKSLKKLDVSRWDVSRVRSFEYLFCGCYELKELDVSKWDTRNVVNLEGMFQNDYQLKYLNVSDWQTSKVLNAVRTFCGLSIIEILDVSKWDTRNLVSAELMFNDCRNIKELDLSNWDISNLECIYQMFGGCKNVKYIKFGKTKNNKKLYTKYGRTTEGVGPIIGNCVSLEYFDISNFEKLPDNELGYNLREDLVILVSSSYSGELVTPNYTLTKIGS